MQMADKVAEIVLPPATTDVTPFEVNVPQAESLPVFQGTSLIDSISGKEAL